MNTFANLAIMFKNEQHEHLAVIRNVNIVKDIMGNHFRTELKIRSVYQYIQTAEMLVRYDELLALVESLNGDEHGPK